MVKLIATVVTMVAMLGCGGTHAVDGVVVEEEEPVACSPAAGSSLQDWCEHDQGQALDCLEGDVPDEQTCDRRGALDYGARTVWCCFPE